MNIFRLSKQIAITLLTVFSVCYNLYAQDTDCDLSGFVTSGQGGWGSRSKSPIGELRDQNFAEVFPEGLLAGSLFTLKLTSSETIADFLPQGHTPSKFNQNYLNEAKTSAGVLAGQLVTALLNCNFNKAGLLGTNTNFTLENLIINTGPFEGLSVADLLGIANSAIGGEETEYSYSQINDALAAVNENFENGNDKGFLGCPLKLRIMSLGKIGDKVWYDDNRSGTQESYETGLEGISVKLFTCDDVLVAETVTAEDGSYFFNNLFGGEYYLKIVLPEYYYLSSPDQGIDDLFDSDFDPVTGKTICFNISDGETNLSLDAAVYIRYGVIGDKVWYDLDKNGLLRLEPAASGVVVKLCDCEGTQKAETTTDLSGKYFFNVVPGFYKIQFIAPPGYIFTLRDVPTLGIDSDAGSDGFTDCTEIAPDETDYSWDAGLIPGGGQPGSGEYVNKPGLNKIESELPSKYALLQNYPNPFNPSTVIRFEIIEQGNYTLKIFNMLGEEVSTLVSENIDPGSYSVAFDGKDLQSGIYIYNLAGDNINLTGKMTLIK